MIKQKKMWYIECDKCKAIYYDGEDEYYYKTKEEAEEYLKMDYNWEIKGEKILCPECQ